MVCIANRRRKNYHCLNKHTIIFTFEIDNTNVKTNNTKCLWNQKPIVANIQNANQQGNVTPNSSYPHNINQIDLRNQHHKTKKKKKNHRNPKHTKHIRIKIRKYTWDCIQFIWLIFEKVLNMVTEFEKGWVYSGWQRIRARSSASCGWFLNSKIVGIEPSSLSLSRGPQSSPHVPPTIPNLTVRWSDPMVS